MSDKNEKEIQNLTDKVENMMKEYGYRSIRSNRNESIKINMEFLGYLDERKKKVK